MTGIVWQDVEEKDLKQRIRLSRMDAAFFPIKITTSNKSSPNWLYIDEPEARTHLISFWLFPFLSITAQNNAYIPKYLYSQLLTHWFQ